ncbi:hypothetical protein [Chryseobacterium ginsengisoli]
MNYKTIIIILILFISCKQNKPEIKSEHISSDNTVIINKEYTEIIKQNNEFKLSCAKPENYNHVKLTDKILHLEIVEPINYEVNKIEQLNGYYKVLLKNEQFYYKVTNVDDKLGVTYWENISNNKTNEDLSFYAIENLKLKSASLKKEDCSSDENNSSLDSNSQNNIPQEWDGDYYLKIKVESIQSDDQIDMAYFININKNNAILSISCTNPNEIYCEGEYSLSQKDEFIHLIHTGETGICTSNIEDSSFDIKKEGTQYYIRSKRFIDYEWHKLNKK